MDFAAPWRQNRFVPSLLPPKHFTNISSLHRILTEIYQWRQGAAGIEGFSMLLQRDLGFSAEQARKYSACVLSQNSEGSADCVSRNARKLIGKWSNGNSAGSAGNLLVTRTESWKFDEGLQYENKNESYEGFVSPFGGGYSRPRSSSNYGLWAPSDRPTSPISIITMDERGVFVNRTVEWTDPEQSEPTGMFLDRVRFGKMW
jgi:hypothetical protein